MISNRSFQLIDLKFQNTRKMKCDITLTLFKWNLGVIHDDASVTNIGVSEILTPVPIAKRYGACRVYCILLVSLRSQFLHSVEKSSRIFSNNGT